MSKKQGGFGMVAVLIILTIVMIAVGICWFVYKKQPLAARPDSSGSQSATPVIAPQSASQPQANPYAGWKSFKSAKVSAQFKYPESWRLETSNDPKLQNFENTLLITPKDSDGYSFTINLLIGDPTSQNGMPLIVYGSKQVGSSYIIFYSSKFERSPTGFTISKYDVSPGMANPDFVEKQYTKDNTIPVIFTGQLSKRDAVTANTTNHEIDMFTTHQDWGDVVKVLGSFSL